MDYASHMTYKKFVSSSTRYTAVANSYTYSNFYFKGTTVSGACSAWTSFTANQLQLPFDDVEFSALTLDTSSYNFVTKTNVSATNTCSSKTQLSAIVSALNKKGNYQAACGGVTWNVKQCSGKNILCADCDDACDDAKTCSGYGSIINACSSCFSLTAAYSVLNAQYALKILYPEFVSIPTVVPARDSMTVNVNITTPGTVYCVSLPTTTTVSSVYTIKAAGSKVIANTKGSYDFTLGGLSPSTNYTVYCYTESFAGNLMPMSVAEANKVATQSDCCRSLQFSTKYSEIVQYLSTSTRAEQPFSFYLDAKPSAALTTAFAYALVSCDDSSVITASSNAVTTLPSSFTFSTTSTSLAGTFLIRSSQQGCFRLTISATGADIYASVSTIIKVNAATAPPPVPTLTGVRMSDRGTSVLFSFDTPTDRASSKITAFASTFDCSQIVTFPGSDSATCKWVNNTMLTATLATTGTLAEVGDSAVLIADIVRAACVADTVCTSYTYVDTVTTTITTARNPLQPTVSLSTSTSISPCGDIVLDPTSSSGFGGRDWKSVTWIVTGSGIAQGFDAIATLLNRNFTDTFSKATVPNSFLTRSSGDDDSIYTIGLTLQNFLLQTSFATVSVKVNGDGTAIVPSITLAGTKDVVYRWKPLSVSAAISWPSCASEKTRSLPVTYAWKLFRGTTFLSDVTSSSLDKRFFKLPAYSLDASTNYLISVTASVTSGSETISSFVSSTLVTGQSDVQASIAGASVRTGSTLENVVIDASTSQDIDYPSKVLTYTWACTEYSPTFGAACEGFTPGTASRLTITAGALFARTYTIAVTVANDVGKVSSASILLTLLETRIPNLVMTDIKAKYNPEDKVVLGGTITTATGAAFAQWTSDSIDSFATAGIALTPLTRTIPAQNAFLYQLSIASGSLVAGLTYKFQLSTYYTNNAANPATSAVTIVMNAPPSGGTLTISPPEGTALNTSFTLNTARWTDDLADLPLSYVISYYTVKITSLNTIKSKDGVSYVTAKLGQGLAENNYEIYCVATASDIYNSAATATVTGVSNPPVDTGAVVGATKDALDNALNNGDPSAVQQAADGALTTVNAVNCTVPIACDTLNREKCSETPKTCGPCLDGYVGADGDSNKKCKLKNGNSRRYLEEGEDYPKSCPNDCSGAGACTFFDQYEQEIPACNVTQPLCRAKCVCDTDVYGKACTLTAAEYDQMLDLRETLCSSIYAAMALQDVSADVVSSRALTISNILLDINQLSDAGLASCTSALVETVTENPAYACTGNAFALVSKALSNVLAKGISLPSDLLTGVSSALAALTTGCQENLSVGEDPVTITTENVNLLTTVTDKESLENVVFDSPQSDLIAESGAAASTVGVDTSSLSDSDSIGITIYEMTSNPNGAVTNSSKVTVTTTLYGDSSSTPGLTLVLQNYEPIDYGTPVEATNHTVECSRFESFPYEVNVTCPSGEVLNVTCPAITQGSYNVTCPGSAKVPQCLTFDGEQFTANPLCTVTTFDEYSTTCYCEAAATRRYLTSGESVATEFSSSTVAIATNFGSTFIRKPSLSDVRKNWVILATLIGVLGTWALGTVYFMRWDRLDHEAYVAREIADSNQRKKVRMVFQFYDSIFPDELRAGSWYRVLLNQLRSQHFLVRLFTNNHKDKSLRTVFWAAAMGKLVAFLFMNSLVASTMYADDGYCETYLDQTSCSDAKTIGGMFDACRWKTSNSSCEFQPPQIDFLTSIIITLIVTMLTVPLDKAIEANVGLWAQYFHYAALEKKVSVASTEGVLLRKYDEFSLSQTHRSTVLRAARLDKARQHMDFIGVEEEARVVEKYAADAAKTWNKNGVTSVFDQITFRRYRYSLDNVAHDAVCKRVQAVRAEADTMHQEMEVMESVEEQEKYLMRQFIVNSFPTIQRGVVGRYFLKEYNLKRTEFVKNMERASLVFLPLFIGFLIFYVYQFNLSIGSRSTNMWLAVTFIGLVQDIILLQPTKIFINFIVINGNVAHDVRQLCERLSKRSKLIMMRTHGMMRDADALIQHFNPACRAARMYPSLPMSRLLMSLNDHDLPPRQLPHVTLIPWAYFSTGVVALVLLPEVLQEVALDISSGAIGDFGLIAFYHLTRVSPVATGLLIGLSGLLVIGLTLYWNRHRVRELFTVAEEDRVPVVSTIKFDINASGAPSPVKAPMPKRSESYTADFESGAAVSDMFTLEQYNADTGEGADYHSVWSLNKKTRRSSVVVVPPGKGARASNETSAQRKEAAYDMENNLAPALRNIKPEPQPEAGHHPVAGSKVAQSFSEDSAEAPANPAPFKEIHKPVLPDIGGASAEPTDGHQLTQEALEQLGQPGGRGASNLGAAQTPSSNDLLFLDGPRAGDVRLKPASSKIRLDPIDRSENGSVNSNNSSPVKHGRSRKAGRQESSDGSLESAGDGAV
jgi:hypothetical protein